MGTENACTTDKNSFLEISQGRYTRDFVIGPVQSDLIYLQIPLYPGSNSVGS